MNKHLTTIIVKNRMRNRPNIMMTGEIESEQQAEHDTKITIKVNGELLSFWKRDIIERTNWF